MAGKKKITVELIQASTKDELLDVAGRLGIEDRVNYRMLKAELLEEVLTEFLAQQESGGETEEAQEEDAAPRDTAAERYAAIKAQRLEGTLPEPEPEPTPEPEKKEISHHILKGKKETIVRPWALYDMRHQLGITLQDLATLERLAMRDGEASVRKVRRAKGRIAKITFIVRYS